MDSTDQVIRFSSKLRWTVGNPTTALLLGGRFFVRFLTVRGIRSDEMFRAQLGKFLFQSLYGPPGFARKNRVNN